MSSSQLNSILDSAKKVAAFPKTTPIYYYAGHGEDECDPVNHKPIVRQVPNDCIYITITECGVYAEIDLFDNPREKLFRSKAPEIKSLLQYPYKPGNKKRLAQLFGLSSPDVLHIHYPGMNYVESFFQPIAYWNDDGELWGENDKPLYMFSISGLLSKNKMEATAKPRKSVSAENNSSFYITKNEIVQYYAESVYPTPAYIEEILDKTFPTSFILSTEEIDTFMTTLVNTMEHDETGMPYSKLSNTYMMEKFPGIHYNVVCRSVSDDCLPEAELHRITSGQQEKNRQHETIETIITSQLNTQKKQKTRRQPKNTQKK